MKLISFRIKNFRSIIDSDWVNFSPDSVTVLVGQNESGKTSVLQALYCALSATAITPDDKRVDAPDPTVLLRIEVEANDLVEPLEGYRPEEVAAANEYLELQKRTTEISCNWAPKKGASALTEFYTTLADPDRFSGLLAKYKNKPKKTPSSTDAAGGVLEIEDNEEESEHPSLTPSLFASALYQPLPGATLFNAETGLLPSTVDIDEKGRPSGNGAIAARNFLTIAEVDLSKLISGDGRYRQNVLSKANQKVSQDFLSFWSQIIGAGSRLSLHCAFEHYNASSGEKSGSPYLEFWIADGNTQLYPRQRSMGVRWFVSFYLQLRATEKSNGQRIFLLDEPGANLHAKAQSDVLSLINKLKKDIPIIYSTHSPQMIEYEKIYRIRAVQRDDAVEDSPTIIIDGMQLGTASTDTLSPILAAMGSDMSNQSVVKKTRNVLLEEMSGFYYLKALWKLTNQKSVAHFIAATGVNKIPALVSMFLGWGLDFVVAVDDDKQGREVFNFLKKEIFGDDQTLATRQLLKLPSGSSIEEIFSASDFASIVLSKKDAKITNGNSEYLKSNQISKPVTAFQFWLAVDAGKIELTSFDAQTTKNIKQTVTAISELLDARN